ncbi:methionyl-tRNA formyltransferase [Flavobacteriaceae bacterium LSUCC0859]|nr:methionyl-tRNA formyltransferase [Flavobacteriaceae bacterium LSUCC0859]
MKTYLLVTEKIWHHELFEDLLKSKSGNWFIINQKENFTLNNIESLKPDYIFIPHWSYIIPSEIFLRFECILFHMTDLPFGRGGSPLQNLIVLEYKETVISAIRVEKGLDTGPVYLKSKLSLLGTAEEIFIRSGLIIKDMIFSIIENNISPQLQSGQISNFRRRKRSESNISSLSDINKVYDYIRMLDAEGYPNAFLETESLLFEFTRASLKANKSIIADVRITKK